MSNDWKSVPETISTLIKEGSVMFTRIREARRILPSAAPGHGHIWFNPKTQHVFFSIGESDSADVYADWYDKLRKIKGVKSVSGQASTHPVKDGPWLLVKKADLQSVFGPVAQAGGWQQGFPANVLGGPSPFSAMVASGVLGAGAGYGLGWLGEKLSPDKAIDKDSHRMRRNMAILGGLLGAAPGLWSSTVNWRHGRSMFEPFGSPPKTAALKRQLANTFELDDTILSKMHKLAELYDRNEDYVAGTNGAFMGGGADFRPVINTDHFNRIVWEDPFTPPPLKGMTSGVLQGASQVAGNSPYISPMDVGRLAVGMGTGLVSGLIVGKTLGALAGLTPQAQDTLQRAGTWAGLIKNVVPIILPRTQPSQFEYVN